MEKGICFSHGSRAWTSELIIFPGFPRAGWQAAEGLLKSSQFLIQTTRPHAMKMLPAVPVLTYKHLFCNRDLEKFLFKTVLKHFFSPSSYTEMVVKEKNHWAWIRAVWCPIQPGWARSLPLWASVSPHCRRKGSNMITCDTPFRLQQRKNRKSTFLLCICPYSHSACFCSRPFTFSSSNFYWSIVGLLFCVSFNSTAKWIGYYTYTHSFFRYFPHIDHYRVQWSSLCCRVDPY